MILLVVVSVSIVAGYLATNEEAVLYPIFNPIRVWLGKRIRTNYREGFMWEGFLARKLACRFCMGWEASGVAVILALDSGWLDRIGLWIAGNALHLAYLEILDAIESD